MGRPVLARPKRITEVIPDRVMCLIDIGEQARSAFEFYIKDQQHRRAQSGRPKLNICATGVKKSLFDDFAKLSAEDRDYYKCLASGDIFRAKRVRAARRSAKESIVPDRDDHSDTAHSNTVASHNTSSACSTDIPHSWKPHDMSACMDGHTNFLATGSVPKLTLFQESGCNSATRASGLSGVAPISPDCLAAVDARGQPFLFQFLPSHAERRKSSHQDTCATSDSYMTRT